MNTRLSLACIAAVLAAVQLPLTATAQPRVTGGAASAAPTAPTSIAGAASTTGASTTPHGTGDWLRFGHARYTPVLDTVTTHLAAARAALERRDHSAAAQAMTAAAQAVKAQGDRAASLDRRRAAADLGLAREAHRRLAALGKKFDLIAARIQAGTLSTPAAFDKTLDKTVQADLERRWLVTDAGVLKAVSQEPQRHFGAAVADVAKRDGQAAAAEVRKGEAYVRLESARATGGVKKRLDAAAADLETTARSLQRGAAKADARMRNTFAKADYALALAHRAKAAESWAHKAYDQAGYELEASAHGVQDAASWVGAEVQAGTARATADAQALGARLAKGGVWAKDEVSKGFESLGVALNRVGHALGANGKSVPVGVGA